MLLNPMMCILTSVPNCNFDDLIYYNAKMKDSKISSCSTKRLQYNCSHRRLYFIFEYNCFSTNIMCPFCAPYTFIFTILSIHLCKINKCKKVLVPSQKIKVVQQSYILTFWKWFFFIKSYIFFLFQE